jgi:hypothetical protein
MAAVIQERQVVITHNEERKASRALLRRGGRATSFDHGKKRNKLALQEGTYQELRTRFKLPAQMACSVPRQVGATYIYSMRGFILHKGSSAQPRSVQAGSRS